MQSLRDPVLRKIMYSTEGVGGRVSTRIFATEMISDDHEAQAK